MISFLQPLALLGLALAALPPLLHLLGRRHPPTVVFPAIQYLTATEREHSRRLKLRNLVLLLLRIAVIVLVVLAASRPVARLASGASHPPTAIAVVLDNSLSSGAVVAGRQTLVTLRDHAARVIAQATEDDHLWLVLSDGVPQRIGRAEGLTLVRSVEVTPVRLDLGEAVRMAAGIVREAGPAQQEVVVLSDLQRSAFSAGPVPDVRVIALAPPPPPENAGIDSAFAEPRIWSTSGAVVAAVGGGSNRQRAVRLELAGRDVARAVAGSGDEVALTVAGAQPGWQAGLVELDPDELRGDDRWWLAVKTGEPAATRAAAGAGTFVEQAVGVLIQGGRVRDGDRVTLGDRLSPGATVLFPPADPALVGAVNRALASRGLSTRLGDLVDGEWTLAGGVGPVTGTAVYRRYRLRGAGAILMTASGEPWLVREEDVVVVGSRMEAPWTALPVSAAFIPFLDFLLNRVAAEQTWIVRGLPGSMVSLPAVATSVSLPTGETAVPGDRRLLLPPQAGVYFLMDQAGDTVGAVEVNHDRRESRLDPATASEVRASWGARAALLSEAAFEREVFGGARRAELTGLLLIGALVAALAELAVATFLGTRRPS